MSDETGRPVPPVPQLDPTVDLSGADATEDQIRLAAGPPALVPDDDDDDANATLQPPADEQEDRDATPRSPPLRRPVLQRRPPLHLRAINWQDRIVPPPPPDRLPIPVVPPLVLPGRNPMFPFAPLSYEQELAIERHRRLVAAHRESVRQGQRNLLRIRDQVERMNERHEEGWNPSQDPRTGRPHLILPLLPDVLGRSRETAEEAAVRRWTAAATQRALAEDEFGDQNNPVNRYRPAARVRSRPPCHLAPDHGTITKHAQIAKWPHCHPASTAEGAYRYRAPPTATIRMA
jgi:hypothetical protein